MKKVVIIGGGITGLSAAFALQQAKEKGVPIEYLVVEKEQRLGGKTITENINGFIIEGGPDCFMSEKPAALQLTEKIGLEDKLLPSNESNAGTFIYSGGRLQKLPDGLMMLVPNKILPFVTSPLISWPGKLRMALDLVIPKKNEDTDETLGGFVKRRMGQELLDKIAEPMIGGIHGGDPETMSLKASFPRFLQMEQNHGSLALAMISSKRKMAKMRKQAKLNPKPPGKYKKSFFMSYKGGMGELVGGVAAKLDPDSVLVGREVKQVEKKSEGGRVVYVVHISGMEPVSADAVIMAAPSNVACNLIENIDNMIAQNLRQIPMSSSANISLVYKKSDIPKDRITAFGFVIPYIEGRRLNAVTYSSLKWNYRVTDDDEYIMLRCFVGKPQRQEDAVRSEAEIEKIVRDELKEVLGITAEPILIKVHKWTNARPQYVMGHLERMKEVDEKLAAEHRGLFLAGACYHGIGVPDCIVDGNKAAEAALAYLK